MRTKVVLTPSGYELPHGWSADAFRDVVRRAAEHWNGACGVNIVVGEPNPTWRAAQDGMNLVVYRGRSWCHNERCGHGSVKLFVSVALCVALCLRWMPHARAEITPPPELHPRRVFALTLSPFHLRLPIVELTGETRVHDKVGVAGILGAGRVKSGATINGEQTSVTVFEIGVQGRYYVLGDFRHGAQIGGEAIYLHGSTSNSSASAVANGFSAGPFVGYKFTADIGFTFDGQIGYQRIGVGGSASDGSTANRKSNAVLLNLNVGWSF